MPGEPRQIAVYGKGGIGKSTVVQNVSAALAAAGHKVLQVGCDPKHDSSRPFLAGESPETIVDLLASDRHREPTVGDYLMKTPWGIDCVEVGGPQPGVGCAGAGILTMFELFEEGGVLSSGYDVVLYDVLGDVVCGGFAAPMRKGYAREVVVVVSGEFMALYAANNICRGIETYARRREVRLAGIVLNRRDVPNEEAVAREFARRVGGRFLGALARDPLVSQAEVRKNTVMHAFPDSPQAEAYRGLARLLLDNTALAIPTPLDDKKLEEMYFKLAYAGT